MVIPNKTDEKPRQDTLENCTETTYIR